MRTTIVFPPSLCLPNQIYYSLPLLSGALRRAGHEVRALDLNVLAAELLLREESVERYLGVARQLAERERSAGRPSAARKIQDELMRQEARMRQGPEAKAVLRDARRCFEGGAFREAFWTVVDDLAFLYQLDPVISPHRPSFAEDMNARLHEDPWSPSRDLWEEGFARSLQGAPAELFAISLAFPEQAFETLRLAREIKRHHPGAHVALGGPLVTGYPEAWLSDGWIFDHVDSVCIGDGESTIVELGDALEGRRGLDAVTNLRWRDRDGAVRGGEGGISLSAMDEIPPPDFESADMGLYLTPGRPIYPIMASRGCYWGRCTFCSIGWRENYRQASATKLAEDVAAIAARPDARYIQVQDSSLPPNAARNLARAIRDQERELYWSAGFKFEKVLLNADYCRDLAEGGCRSLLMGFESSDQAILERMDKGYDIKDLPAMLDNLRGAGISAELLWFIGFPGETKAQSLATARYLHDHRDRFGLTAFVGNYLLHPDSMIFERPADFGVTVTGLDNDRCTYEVDEGMSPADTEYLKGLLATNNNRTLVCNGSQLPHLVERGLDATSWVGRPHRVPEAASQWVEEPDSGASRAPG
jgi:Radical SAM superfamily/B12 binding domain